MTNQTEIPISTYCYRNYPQIKLMGSIVKQLINKKGHVKIKIFSVSTGQEAFSLASYFFYHNCLDKVLIEASDSNVFCVNKANEFSISKNDYYRVPKEIRKISFNILSDGRIFLKKDIKSCISFYKESVFSPIKNKYDIVICQNLMVHLSEKDVVTALNGLVSVTENSAYLVVGGGQHRFIASELTRRGLVPVTIKLKEIHDSWVPQRSAWESVKKPYWALEPFDESCYKEFSSIYKKIA